MPVYREFLEKDYQIFIWKYEDGEVFVKEELLELENFPKVEVYSQLKLLEVLMVRKLLKTKFPKYKIYYQDKIPYLYPRDFEISITHSFPFSVLGISKKKIGIDIEKINQRILNLKDKFAHPDETKLVPESWEMEYFTRLWAIKEGLYKIHKSKLHSFKNHYKIASFDEQTTEIQCSVYGVDFEDFFVARIEEVEDYCLAIVLEQ